MNRSVAIDACATGFPSGPITRPWNLSFSDSPAWFLLAFRFSSPASNREVRCSLAAEALAPVGGAGPTAATPAATHVRNPIAMIAAAAAFSLASIIVRIARLASTVAAAGTIPVAAVFPSMK